MTATVEAFRCLACRHEFSEKVEKGEDKERSCPRCRSNSIRHLKREPEPRQRRAGRAELPALGFR